jgi:hypothetical protein
MHSATDGSAPLASVERQTHEFTVFLDDRLCPERSAIAAHIDAWASHVDAASSAQLAVVPLIPADELARFCRSDRSPVVLVYGTRSSYLDVAAAELHAAAAERVITGPALVVAAHLLALARLLAPRRFRAGENRLSGTRSAPNQGTPWELGLISMRGWMPTIVDPSL